jgi:hypothetical protein
MMAMLGIAVVSVVTAGAVFGGAFTTLSLTSRLIISGGAGSTVGLGSEQVLRNALGYEPLSLQEIGWDLAVGTLSGPILEGLVKAGSSLKNALRTRWLPKPPPGTTTAGDAFQKYLATKDYSSNVELDKRCPRCAKFPVFDFVTPTEVISSAAGKTEHLKRKFFEAVGMGRDLLKFEKALKLLVAAVGEGPLARERLLQIVRLAILKSSVNPLLKVLMKHPAAQEVIEERGLDFIKKLIIGHKWP